MVQIQAVTDLVAIELGWYLYSRQFEETGDTQVDGHLNPVAVRVDETIKAVYVNDKAIRPMPLNGGQLSMSLAGCIQEVAQFLEKCLGLESPASSHALPELM